MKYTLHTFALLLLVSFAAPAQISDKPPAQTIPQFSFFAPSGSTFTEINLPSGKLIFFMFIDPDCDHCQLAIKKIGDQYQTFKKVSVYVISIDGWDKINHFMNTYGNKLKGKNILILQDRLQQFITRFAPIRYPAMFLYSPEKKLIDYEDNPEAVFRIVNAINKNIKQ